jgi:hypothetical protein
MAEFDLRHSSDTVFAIALASLASALLIITYRRSGIGKGDECGRCGHAAPIGMDGPVRRGARLTLEMTFCASPSAGHVEQESG